MTTTENPRRVRLVRTGDEHTDLKPGDEGTVMPFSPDSMGTVHVKWDNGSTLGLIPGQDRWEEIS